MTLVSYGLGLSAPSGPAQSVPTPQPGLFRYILAEDVLLESDEVNTTNEQYRVTAVTSEPAVEQVQLTGGRINVIQTTEPKTVVFHE